MGLWYTPAMKREGDFEMAKPHRRQNLLTGDWVLVSPQRALRPWQGQQEKPSLEERPLYDPSCYLCPGNERAAGTQNPNYPSTYIFDNDFPALLDDAHETNAPATSLFRTQPVNGTCRVICFSPRHDLTLPDLLPDEMDAVLKGWGAEVETLGKKYRWVQVFENKGAVMGCSNPHPHGQIWALSALPNEARKEVLRQTEYYIEHQRKLLLDVAREELRQQERVVLKNEEWLVVVPHWALWPFETLLIPLRATRHLDALDDAQRDALSDILRRLLRRYDNVFGVSFPYSMGWHGAPFASAPAAAGEFELQDEHVDAFQLHAHFYPPLLRSATVKKFMVGFEMLGEGQRDVTPEQAAETLRNASETPLRPRL